MTRITNFGIKRTYVQAEFETKGNDTASNSVETNRVIEPTTADTEPTAEPHKKKRRLRKSKSKKAINASSGADLNDHDGALPSTASDHAKEERRRLETKKGDGKQDMSRKKPMKSDRKKSLVSAAESRRLKRVKDRLAQTTCFACRKKGHAAKDCPKATAVVSKTPDGEDGQVKSVRAGVGICYRCGSNRHSLSRCKKPNNNPDDPYPFASCFVCNGKGHLASSCPQNKAKGIYPNGGCCKLCGETTHLARNCGMRHKANDPTAMIIGIGATATAHEAGADEDDFHAFRRTTAELDLREKREEKARRMLEIKRGALSGTLVKLGSTTDHAKETKKKIVTF